jgi:dephospho-CoA kinase
MRIIGITGGVGAGKSLVLDYLHEEYGAVVYQADQVAKDLQRKGTDCYAEIVRSFGKEILQDDGELNREKLAKIVFTDQEKLQELNHIVHPAVQEFLLQKIEEERNRGTRYMIIEAALLLEAKYDSICDEVWYIHASEDVRTERLMSARGYSREKISSMMEAQLPESVFREGSTVTIENDRDFEDTKRQIGALLK